MCGWVQVTFSFRTSLQPFHTGGSKRGPEQGHPLTNSQIMQQRVRVGQRIRCTPSRRFEKHSDVWRREKCALLKESSHVPNNICLHGSYNDDVAPSSPPSFFHQDFLSPTHRSLLVLLKRKSSPSTNTSLFSYKIYFFSSYNKQDSSIFSVTKIRYDELFVRICSG